MSLSLPSRADILLFKALYLRGFMVQVLPPKHFCLFCGAKKLKKYTGVFRLFLLLNAKNGLRSSQSTSPKPVFLLFAQYLLRKQRKPSLVVVDKRGSFHGGRGWIRTIVVCDNGFTVRSLWPLGNPSESSY